ncbi:acetolactate synthase large subunit [Archaeoglobus profundus]|uniref:Acetolactate synthase n=1 Tax=Archaeoglobus profundus (strain DSM 5631 / JCM 9629 / NBRC 100127 / Av18) TaxID=572546 RepID=D2RG17_ARCPA|nr:acetolactate synthase large subunit [Archaeoglobus profundus]ADB57242.1 acetolactate synthase, large subunit, biosynthetic type [Archaeoglobus profundus DSM 5631]
MRVADAIVKALEKEGVEVAFGIPGGAIMEVYDALYDSNITHILARHEQGAVHMADGYARASGRVGVAFATSGPGATNTVTGIATAYMDSSPLIVFTGQVPRAMIGNDAFQEADITGITMPITKHNYLVTDEKEVLKIVKEAFYIASTGRPGPVLIDLPKDVTQADIDFDYPEKIEIRGYKPKIHGHPNQIKRAVELIMKSERPIILAGGGVRISNAHPEVLELAEKIPAFVVTTLMGKGAIPEEHPLSLGFIGMHGTKYGNLAVMDADLIIAVGCRFSDRTVGKFDEFAPNAKIIHIDIDPAEIGKNVRVDVPIVGDAKHVLREIIKFIEFKARKEWFDYVNELRRKYPLKYEYREDVIKPQFVIEKVYELFPDAIVTTEVGQNQMWAAQYFKVKYPRQFITSGGLGTMGFGFPAAIGAKVAFPDKVVIDIAGDGSFLMNIQELATAVDYGINVIVCVLNNAYLGMVRQWQELFYNKRYSATRLRYPELSFEKIAKGFGAHGITVEKPSEVEDALKEARDVDKPVVIDFHVEVEENVFPFVPPGKSLREVLG